MNYAWLDKATDEDRRKFLRYIEESIRRARSRRGWLKMMLPVWVSGLVKVKALLRA